MNSKHPVVKTIGQNNHYTSSEHHEEEKSSEPKACTFMLSLFLHINTLITRIEKARVENLLLLYKENKYKPFLVKR